MKSKRNKLIINKPLAIFMISVSFLFNSGIIIKSNAIERFDKKYIVYTVNKSDTVWGIAGKYNVKDKDKRELIDKIKEINNIDDKIYENDNLIIPIN